MMQLLSSGWHVRTVFGVPPFCVLEFAMAERTIVSQVKVCGDGAEACTCGFIEMGALEGGVVATLRRLAGHRRSECTQIVRVEPHHLIRVRHDHLADYGRRHAEITDNLRNGKINLSSGVRKQVRKSENVHRTKVS